MKTVSIALTLLLLTCALSAAKGKHEQIETVYFSIDSTSGLFPRAVTRPKGRFVLIVRNKLGNANLVMRLDDDKGNRKLDISLKDSNGDWCAVVDLTPGTYVFSEAAIPNLRSTITVTP